MASKVFLFSRGGSGINTEIAAVAMPDGMGSSQFPNVQLIIIQPQDQYMTPADCPNRQ